MKEKFVVVEFPTGTGGPCSGYSHEVGRFDTYDEAVQRIVKSLDVHVEYQIVKIWTNGK